MNGKIRILLSVISAISVISLCSCGKAAPAATTTAVTTQSTTGVWESTPETVEFSTEPETTYASCETPFSEAFNAKLFEIEDRYGEDSFTGVYIDKSGNSLIIGSYTDDDGYIDFCICKFKDGKVINLTVDTEMKKFGDNDDLLIDKNSNILVLRYYVDDETIRQIIYDFSDDEYIAVRDRNFGYDDIESMETAVTEYNSAEMNLISFSENAVTEDVNTYIESNLSTES